MGKCYKNPSTPTLYGTEQKQEGLTASKYTPFLNRNKGFGDIPPCIYAKPILDYFNNPTVMKQLNILPEANPWDMCVDPADFNYTGSQNATQWIYPILQGRYKILKYSGDTDGAVATYGTQQWINELNWEVTEPWRPFYITNQFGKQVAGYVEGRAGGFTFATIHGAGHMTP